MSGTSQINYGDALAGRIRTRRSVHPLGAWLAAQGATYRGSSEFVDADLRLSDDHFQNVLKIIKSARNQGHDGVEIRLTPESLSAVASRIAEISALEDVDINARFYGEYLKKEQMIATFRDRKSDWLLALAKKELSANEYDELFQLINARLTRSEREVFLTEKAIAGNHSHDHPG
jgi:hypothetical protein